MFAKLRSEATLREKVSFSGIGVHSGITTDVNVYPAQSGTGIVFKRIDVVDKENIIKLSPETVIDPTLCTRCVNKNGVSIAVIEHLLAAFRICEITNAIVEVNAGEIPIMDGSAIEFVNQFKKVGIITQEADVPAIVISEPVSVSYNSSRISIVPDDECKISVTLSYDRINPVLNGNNKYFFKLNGNLTELAMARTFGWLSDYDKIRQMGLGKGSSKENTVVINNENNILNEEGLRNPLELVMHKCLDLIGDISVIGYDIIGSIHGINTSHMINNLLMRKLLKELDKHSVIEENNCYNTLNYEYA